MRYLWVRHSTPRMRRHGRRRRSLRDKVVVGTRRGIQYWMLKADDILNIEVQAVTVALLRSRDLRSSRFPRRRD